MTQNEMITMFSYLFGAYISGWAFAFGLQTFKTFMEKI